MTKTRLNCWEYMKCGNHPKDKNTYKQGACPATTDATFEGINSGKFGGRICWAVSDTLCGENSKGTYIDKRAHCLKCNFFKQVRLEEGIQSPDTKFLKFITKNDRSPIFENLTYKFVKSGERFIFQGKIEDSAYIIQKGSCLVIVEKDGEFFPVKHYGEGDMVGGLGIFTGEPRHAHVEAETDVELWELKREHVQEISEKDPEILNFLTELINDRLDSKRPISYRTIGKYIATDIIGRGAFSIVYKGAHKILDLPVAIKMMRHNMVTDPDFLASFHNEAKTIASLDHPNIVKIYDIDERFRTVFIIMEYVKGESLREMQNRLKTIPPLLTANFLLQLCSALQYAHKKGVIHRDINPTNMIIKKNDIVKLLDFGLSCPIGTEDMCNTGTAFYMAPEQIEGAPVDERTDLYALSICAFEMITGKRPFPEKNLARLLEFHNTQDVPDPIKLVENLPETLRQFIIKAGKCKPEERLKTADEAMELLHPLIAESNQVHENTQRVKRKMDSFFLIYSKDQQKQLNTLKEEFYDKLNNLGIKIRMTDSVDI